jgi:hypothetical protein
MKLRLFTVALLMVACGHTRGGNANGERSSLPRGLPGLEYVNPADGIDAAEAMTIASEYLVRYISGCGGPDGMVKQGRTWVFGMRLGVLGKKSEDTIQVDAVTGGVFVEGGPRFGDFASFSTAKIDDRDELDPTMEDVGPAHGAP